MDQFSKKHELSILLALVTITISGVFWWVARGLNNEHKPLDALTVVTDFPGHKLFREEELPQEMILLSSPIEIAETGMSWVVFGRKDSPAPTPQGSAILSASLGLKEGDACRVTVVILDGVQPSRSFVALVLPVRKESSIP